MNVQLGACICYLICFLLELGSVIYMILKYNSDCLQYSEISLYISVYFFTIFFVLLPDFWFALLTLKFFRLHRIGTEPTSIMFNCCAFPIMVVAGAATVYIGFSKKCKNPDRILIMIAGIFIAVSGIVHLINCIVCHRSLGAEERNWREKRNQRKLKRANAANIEANKT